MPLQRILLIDDEEDIRTIAELSLTAVGGWEVSQASNGQEGIARALADRPDLILLDVMMPGMDGPAVFDQIRKIEALGDVPVIFMTAKAQKREVESYKALGAVGVIVKPFDPMTLPDSIRTIISDATGPR